MAYRWTCTCCGGRFDELPLCWGFPAPDDYMDLPEAEREVRAQLTPDVCIIDEERFYVRGLIEIPILGTEDVFAWTVWASLSITSFDRMVETWDDDDRHQTSGPFFGWLNSDLPYDPGTGGLKTMVHQRPPGFAPLIELEPTDHPLAIEQRDGVTLARVAEIAGRMASH
jgi:hypothetical protein